MQNNKPLGFGKTLFAVIAGASITTSILTLPISWNQDNIERKVDKLLKQRPIYELRVENVVGRESPEKFYEIGGKRVYLEIDGKPIEQYIQER